MAAVPSNNRLHAEINRYFWILVFVNPEENPTQKPLLLSANGVEKLIDDEKLKIKTFERVLKLESHKTTVKIRKRLKIDFYIK